jgi:hypothetical protein
LEWLALVKRHKPEQPARNGRTAQQEIEKQDPREKHAEHAGRGNGAERYKLSGLPDPRRSFVNVSRPADRHRTEIATRLCSGRAVFTRPSSAAAQPQKGFGLNSTSTVLSGLAKHL